MLNKQRQNLALFDFDGTLTTRDAYSKFIGAATPQWRLIMGLALTWPLVIAYRLNWLPGRLGRALVAWICFYRVPCGKVEAIAKRFAANDMLTFIRPDVLAVLQAHLAQGDCVAVVSGSFDLYLQPWCEQHQVTLICSSLERDGDVFTGYYNGEQCVAIEKARRVQRCFDLKKYRKIYAYGDTTDDRELLALAHHKFYRGVEILDLASI
jgi:phosphatidylglycerophosphatase C